VIHTYRLRVYFEDTDAGGVVYHANYLRFAERARTEAMRAGGVPHAALVAQHGLMFMVRRVNLEYWRPARLDDEIEVTTESRAIGAATIDVRQEFRTLAQAGGHVLAGLDLGLVCVRWRDGRPARIPARWRAALAPSADGMAGGGIEGVG
jgi:acyl-CoA thioester hydrolase